MRLHILNYDFGSMGPVGPMSSYTMFLRYISVGAFQAGYSVKEVIEVTLGNERPDCSVHTQKPLSNAASALAHSLLRWLSKRELGYLT